MLRIQMIGLALMAALAMTAVAASSASAAHLWLLGGNLIASPVTIHSHGTLELEDTKATGGAVRVKCTGFDTGTVGPHALDLISKITLEKLGTKDLIGCSFAAGKNGACETGTEPTALALNLPWHTELYLEGTEVRDMVVSEVAGKNAGWNVRCKAIFVGPIEDDCTVALTSTGLVTDMGLGVLAKFDAKSALATCSIGGANSGKVEGIDILLNPGAQLSFD